jgi:hypothetical protein
MSSQKNTCTAHGRSCQQTRRCALRTALRPPSARVACCGLAPGAVRGLRRRPVPAARTCSVMERDRNLVGLAALGRLRYVCSRLSLLSTYGRSDGASSRTSSPWAASCARARQHRRSCARSARRPQACAPPAGTWRAPRACPRRAVRASSFAAGPPGTDSAPLREPHRHRARLPAAAVATRVHASHHDGLHVAEDLLAVHVDHLVELPGLRGHGAMLREWICVRACVCVWGGWHGTNERT